jgi:hypothetical protein
MNQVQEESVDNFKEEVLENSFELKAFRYLIKASRYSFKIRTFDFLNPGNSEDGGFGPGYVSTLKIGRSQTRLLEVQYSNMESKLLSTLERSVASYNIAIKSFKNNLQGLKNSQERYESLKEQFLQSGIYNANNFSDAVLSLFRFQSQVIESQLKYLNAKSKLDRLAMRSPYYESLLTFSPSF